MRGTFVLCLVFLGAFVITYLLNWYLLGPALVDRRLIDPTNRFVSPTHDTLRRRRDRIARLSFVRRVLIQAWRDLLSVYYANTPIWRLFKSAGLLFFGFFCWSASSLVLSYGISGRSSSTFGPTASSSSSGGR